MITLLSKVKTLIEYARFGMFVCKFQNGETGELYFPRAIQRYDVGSASWRSKATSMKGRVKTIGGNNFLLNNPTLKEIDLPECNNLMTYPWGTNSTLKIAKLPSVREINASIFQNFTALEYLELGSLLRFNANTLNGCTALKEFYVGEGINCTLSLQYCPNLTQECLHSIIENYEDMSASAYPPTLCLGGENIKKIDEDHLAILSWKNIEVK